MAVMRVNPTRMELTRLKKQLKTASRGHKLLKDKRDELMKQFLDIVRENKALREQVEALLKNANDNFLLARAMMSAEALETAIIYPTQSVSLAVGSKKYYERRCAGILVPDAEYRPVVDLPVRVCGDLAAARRRD